ncbi:M6 family metalloprotease domain-containing protein [Streptomyces monticola]|uniref:M6 family metalloprotease domain-containing protein n=1 Tax=Streptomyces monticola TaxID=2666263 RepID=A0ABW2JI84_9ACTN
MFRKAAGVVKAYTVFVDFPDVPAEGTPQERYREFFPAVPDYFAKSSYGKLRYESTPRFRWIRMAKPLAAYGIDRGVSFRPGYSAVSAEVDAAVGDGVDLSSYDLLNVLFTPNAGPPATEKVLSVTFGGTSFIWSRQTGDSAWRVLAHENAHAFGLPDLYGFQGYPPHPVGHWDPMDEDWGPTNDFMAWHKWKLGWLDREQVGCVSGPGVREFTLTPVSDAGGLKLVSVRLNDRWAINIEVRTKSELDPAVCRPGVLVSTVGVGVKSGAGPVRVFDARPGSGGCELADDVATELSDATYLPGQTFTGPGRSVAVQVLGVDGSGGHQGHQGYRVRVALGRQAVGGLPPAAR